MSKETFESDFSNYERELSGYETELANLLRPYNQVDGNRATRNYFVTDEIFNLAENIKSKIEGARKSMLNKYRAVIDHEEFHTRLEDRYSKNSRRRRINDAAENTGTYYIITKVPNIYISQKPRIDYQQQEESERRAREEAERNRLAAEHNRKHAEEERLRQLEAERQRNLQQQQLIEARRLQEAAEKRARELEKENKTMQEKTTLEKNLKDELSNGQYQSQEIDNTHIKISYLPSSATSDPRKAYRALINQLRKTMVAAEAIGDIKNENGSLVIELNTPEEKTKLEAFLSDIAVSKNTNNPRPGH